MEWSFARSAWWCGLVVVATLGVPARGETPNDDLTLPVVASFGDEIEDESAGDVDPATIFTAAPEKAAPAPPPPKKGGVSHTSCCWGEPVDWTKVPAWLCPLPRTGFFPILPSGPGYYSAADWLTGNWRENRPVSGYPPFALMPASFFDADFRYVETKPKEERSFYERLKRIYLTDCIMFSTGGNAWIRFHKENNSRLTTFNNEYALPRVRAYGDLWFGDTARIFGEYIWADALDPELVPPIVDENFGDIQNLFLDANLVEWDGAPVVARVGRQELLFGSQRLISPPDWANTRRKFDGVRGFRRGEKWDLDVFWAQVVPPLATKLDRADSKQDFTGAWATYHREKGEALDFYYLFLNDTNQITRQGIVEAPTEVSTLGTRWCGDENSFLWDFETAVQFGDQGPHNQLAYMATASVGKNMKDWKGAPTGWICYDYASGDADPGDGTVNTFNQLYAFPHYYLGWADLVGRRNIHDANAELYFYPTKWTTVWLQYHHFWLAEARDALYGVSGAAYRRDPTGQAGTNVGNEVDIILNFHLTETSDILLAYCKLFGGEFLEGTAGPGLASDSEVMYFMYQVRW